MDDLSRYPLRNYRLLEKIGHGRKAEVYLAQHATLPQSLAIKFICAELSMDDKFCAQFEREAQIFAGLTHPNLARVFDFGIHQNRCFLVIEYLKGITLKEYLKKKYISGNLLPLEEIIKIITQIGGALAYLHQAGIIHREIKPDNIWLTQDGRICLSDFGVARTTDLDGDQTSWGAILGTPAYMSPEHILSEGVHISPASDIYSLGIILYEMLAGEPPFTANTPILLMLKHLNEPIPHLNTPLLNIPEVLEEIICKALAKDPAQRYQDANLFLHDLQETLKRSVRFPRLQPEPALC
ncbi:MAG: hypothetical protein Fur0022_19580 [Anaerolineales bacterium]